MRFRKTETVLERFWRYTYPCPITGCWLWFGAERGGYGRLWEGRHVEAHRWAYEHFVGPVPEGLVLDHFKCSNPRCVNPEHVRPVTRRENCLRSDTSRAAVQLAKRVCHVGHDAWVYNEKTGLRFCRECRRKTAREWAQRKRDSDSEFRAKCAQATARRRAKTAK